MDLHFNKKSLHLKNIRKYGLILALYLFVTANPSLYFQEIFLPDLFLRDFFNNLFELLFSPLFVKLMTQIISFALVGNLVKKAIILMRAYLFKDDKEYIDISSFNWFKANIENENLENANPFLYSNKTVSLRE